MTHYTGVGDPPPTIAWDWVKTGNACKIFICYEYCGVEMGFPWILSKVIISLPVDLHLVMVCIARLLSDII